MRYPLLIWSLLLYCSCKQHAKEELVSKPVLINDSLHLVDLSLSNDEHFERRRTVDANRFNDSLSEEIMFITGRFNEDEVEDTAYLMRPASFSISISETGRIDSVKNTFVYVRFTCELPYLVVNNCYGGSVSKVEDLDGNGTNELLFEPEWVQSCWSRIDLYRFHEGNWQRSYSAPNYRCDDAFTKHVEKGADGIINLYANGERTDTTYNGTDTLVNFEGVERKVYKFKLD